MPVVITTYPIQIFNLFRKGDIKEEPLQDIMRNFKSLTPTVYLCSLILVAMIIFHVVVKVTLHKLVASKGPIHVSSDPKGYQNLSTRATRQLSTIMLITKSVLSHLKDIFYYSDDNFKLIGLLYALLVFFMVLGINSVFTTNQIQLKNPDVIKNFDDLMKHPTASPCMQISLNDLGSCSNQDNKCKATLEYFRKKYDPQRNCNSYQSYQAMFEKKDVIIDSSDPAEVQRKRLCIQYILKWPEVRTVAAYYVQGSRGTPLVGFVLSRLFLTEEVTLKLYRLVESDLFLRVDTMRGDLALDLFRSDYNLTKERFDEVMKPCDQDYVPDDSRDVPQRLSFNNISSLISLMLFIFAIAGVILVIEINFNLSSMH